MYSTADEVRLALAPLLAQGQVPTQDTAAAMLDAQINDAIVEADARIDGYLGGRYAVPVQPIQPVADPPTYPAQITAWSRDLAAYGLTLTLYRNKPMEQTNPAYLRYQQVMADLAAVQRGTMVLAIPVAVDGNSGGYAGVVNATPADLFGPSDWGAPPRLGRSGRWPGDPGLGRYGWS